MTHSRRIAFLMLFSALVAPAQAMAAGCSSGDLGIDRSFARDFGGTVMRNVVIAGVMAVAAFAIVPAIGTVGAMGIFVGINMFRGVSPPIRRAGDQTFAAFENSFDILME